MTADRPVADREPLSAEPYDEGQLRTLRAFVETNNPDAIWTYEVVARLLATLDAAQAHPDEAGLDLSNKTLLAQCLGNFTADAWRSLPSEVRGGWLENATDVQRAIACYSSRAALAQPAVPVAGAEDWYDRDAKAFARAHTQTAALRAAQPEDDGLARSTAPATGPGLDNPDKQLIRELMTELAALRTATEEALTGLVEACDRADIEDRLPDGVARALAIVHGFVPPETTTQPERRDP